MYVLCVPGAVNKEAMAVAKTPCSISFPLQSSHSVRAVVPLAFIYSD